MPLLTATRCSLPGTLIRSSRLPPRGNAESWEGQREEREATAGMRSSDVTKQALAWEAELEGVDAKTLGGRWP